MKKCQNEKMVKENRNGFSLAQPEHANDYDYLTGLPNMSYFYELATADKERFLKQGERPVLMFFDLNGMKFFNNRFGYEKGDILLKEFSQVLARHFGKDKCCRFAQDHFAAYSVEEGLEETLCEILEETGRLNGGNSLPVRIGIYRDAIDSVHVAAACDRAKYVCDLNRDTYESAFYYFDDELLAQAQNRQYILDHLDQAIEENWIHVYYQPIVRAANGRVCDEEALARWIDPQKGVLSPAMFIPVLENAKLIYRLDLCVLDQILAKMKYQQKVGLYLVPTSINISRADFDSCDIVEEIRRRVDASGVSRKNITIEITESTVGSNFSFIKEQVRRFHELGFSVWMDDFGSGYSSLDVLQDIHFDLIKFDMRFMQQFDKGDKSRIILTELMKMAIGLGSDTVTEGVETKEQAEFLKEIGCTKLQGYYYCRPIPMEEIMRRYEQGEQIGFENPDETDYYAAIGRINLYDQSIMGKGGEERFKHYFNTIPMAIYEIDEENFMITRSNRSYREFIQRYYSSLPLGTTVPFSVLQAAVGLRFTESVKQCREHGKRIFVSTETASGLTVHSLLRHIAINPVTGIAACAEVIIGVTDESDRGVTYSRIAQALSVDYIYLYYVDPDTEEFTEYASAPTQESMSLERRGRDFFAASRKDALQFIYEKDRDYFIRSFTKENVLQAIAERGAFTLSYRLLVEGKPTYVNMKAVRMDARKSHIIIGVNNVDKHMKQKAVLDRLREEQITYSRISALAGNFICVYTVDPVTDRYAEYSATRDYEVLGLAKEGEDFFVKARKYADKVIFADDLPEFREKFTKDNVMRAIEKTGLFILQYHLMIEGEPVPVNVRAAMVDERDGKRLIIGVNKAEAYTHRPHPVTD